MNDTVTLRRVLAVLLIATAALFAIGVAIEGGEESHPDETSEATESGEEGEEDEEDEETVLGIDLESPVLVAAAVVVSVLLAAGALWRPSRGLFIAIAMIALLFAIADIAEAVNKFEEDEAGIGALATIVAVGHLAAAAIATRLTTTRTALPAP